MPYSYLDDIAIADIAFEAWGISEEEMFVAAADATMNVMVEDLTTIEKRETRQVALEADDLEMLLFSLLQELIFYKDAEQLLLRVPHLTIGHEDGRYNLTAEACGEKIDTGRHELLVDVKAVTLHRYRVEQTARGWQATVVLDI